VAEACGSLPQASAASFLLRSGQAIDLIINRLSFVDHKVCKRDYDRPGRMHV